MPANTIRRSDDKATEKYSKFAEKLQKFQESVGTPKMYEFGKSAAYQQADTSVLPTFTTNMITLSQLNKSVDGDMTKTASVAVDVNEGLSERAKQRRIIAQLGDDINLDSLLNNVEQQSKSQPCEACGGKMLYDKDHDMFECLDCGNVTGSEFDEEFPPSQTDIMDKGDDILEAVSSLLPKNGKMMNKMASGIVTSLIRSSKIDEGQKQWFNAQVENGIINNDVFMRNLRIAMSDGGAN